jgi:hypothetical protein
LSWADVTSDVPCTAATIAGSSPPSASQNARNVSLAITGTNFVQGPTFVKLTKSGQPDIIAKDVNVSDSGNLTATFDLTNADLGAWSVVVATCANSPSTLTDAFTVGCDAPTVTDITPGVGVRGTTVTAAAVTGSNFIQTDLSPCNVNQQVKLTMSGQPDIIGTAVSVSNSGNLTVDITIPPDAVPGFRDLVLMTCGSPVVLVNAFEVVCSPPADFNCDTFVDGLDYVAFEACSSGAEVPVTAGCEHMDLDGDGDADGDDFGKFQKCFKGSAEPQTDANCGN